MWNQIIFWHSSLHLFTISTFIHNQDDKKFSILLHIGIAQPNKNSAFAISCRCRYLLSSQLLYCAHVWCCRDTTTSTLSKEMKLLWAFCCFFLWLLSHTTYMNEKISFMTISFFLHHKFKFYCEWAVVSIVEAWWADEPHCMSKVFLILVLKR